MSKLPITEETLSLIFLYPLIELSHVCGWTWRFREMICCALDTGVRRGLEIARKIITVAESSSTTIKTKTTALTRGRVYTTSSGLFSFPSLVSSACSIPSSSLVMVILVQSFNSICFFFWIFILVSCCFNWTVLFFFCAMFWLIFRRTILWNRMEDTA